MIRPMIRHCGRPVGCDYFCTTGIWQTVWLEPAPPMRIQDLFLKPLLDVEPHAIHLGTVVLPPPQPEHAFALSAPAVRAPPPA